VKQTREGEGEASRCEGAKPCERNVPGEANPGSAGSLVPHTLKGNETPREALGGFLTLRLSQTAGLGGRAQDSEGEGNGTRGIRPTRYGIGRRRYLGRPHRPGLISPKVIGEARNQYRATRAFAIL